MRKDSKRETTHKLKSGRFIVHEDFESRPTAVRLHYRGRSTNVERDQPVRRLAQRVLALVRSNIDTNLNGRWTPIQWGDDAGQKALQGTEKQWTAKKVADNHYQVQPFKKYQKRWRGHIGGMKIIPRRAKALRFLSYGGGILYKAFVKLPKRDPRPTETQLRRLQ